MKFMVFNLMAVIAILYLAAAGESPASRLPDFLTSAGAKGDAQKGSELAERARKRLASFEAMVEKTEAPVQKPTPKVVPAPKPVEVAVRSVNKVPVMQVNKLKFKPNAQKPAPKMVEAFAPKSARKFMSRTERRHALNRLAHDMEAMFADKLSD